MTRRILVLGAPRSATTWVAEVLSLAEGARYMHEPDNEKTSLLARYLKSHLPRFPYLRPGWSDPDYRLLWRSVSEGALGPALARAGWLGAVPGRRATESFVARKERAGSGRLPSASLAASIVRRLAAVPAGARRRDIRVVKSVHGVLASEWIAEAAAADQVVIVQRNPCAVVASLRRMGMPDAFRSGCLDPEVQKAAFGRLVAPTDNILVDGPVGGTASLRAITLQLAAIHRLLRAAADRNPAWAVVSHEELCCDPVAGFQRLYDRIGLRWGERAREGIERRDRPGEGFSTARLASAQIDKWRKDLTPEEVALVKGTLEVPEVAGAGTMAPATAGGGA